MVKVVSVALGLLLAASFQMAAGLKCDSQCSACWKIGSPGVDIKIGCRSDSNCFYPCPNGYENLHCANWQRCEWVDSSMNTYYNSFSSSGLTHILKQVQGTWLWKIWPVSLWNRLRSYIWLAKLQSTVRRPGVFNLILTLCFLSLFT